jgi:hypothetical protein
MRLLGVDAALPNAHRESLHVFLTLPRGPFGILHLLAGRTLLRAELFHVFLLDALHERAAVT